MNTLPPLISLHEAQALHVMRFKATPSDKAAILPFFVDKQGVPRFVVYAPVPQHEGEHGRILPYQIARGTIRSEYRVGENTLWQDKGRSNKLPAEAQWVRDETPAEAALREGEEELGMPPSAVETLYDCGALPYQNPRGVVYALHVFLAKIPDADALAFPDPYICAARLGGMSYNEAVTLAAIPTEETSFERRPFKDTYLTLLQVLHDTVLECCV